MNYYLLLLILFNRPGDIRDVIHLDTIEGKDQCVAAMKYRRQQDLDPRGSVLSCTPVKPKIEKAESEKVEIL